MQRTPMQLVAGSLGGGKTTLLRRLLQQDMGRVAVLLNEFGELGIDGQVLEGENIRLVELPGGCVCCSLAGEFEAAVEEVITRTAPECILVETTGVAEADALVLDIEEQLPQVRLEAVIVMVDADVCARFPALGYTERAQIETADLLILNKADLVEPGQLEAISERLRHDNGQAALMTASYADVDPRLVLPERPAVRRAEGAVGHPDHRHTFATFTWNRDRELERSCFEKAIEAWPESVYRAKGFVRIEGRLWLFNYVAGRWQLDPVAEGDPTLVWIGPQVDRFADQILTRLEACIV